MAMIVKTGQPRLAKDVCRLLEDPSLGLCSLLELAGDYRGDSSSSNKEQKQHEDFGLRCTIVCGGANEPIRLVFLFPKGTFEHKMVRQPPKATLVALLRKKLPSASISVDGRCIGGSLSIEIPRARGPSFVKISRSLMDADLLSTMMSQVRVYTLGLPIMIEFQKLMCNNGIVEDGSADDQYVGVPLEIHKTYERSNNGFSLLEITNQKLVISFKVDVADEIERALTRVLLQAVAGTKTNARLCEYRKDWKTVETAMRKAGGGDHYSLAGDHDHCAGFIVFTFFAAHAQQLSECDSLVPSCANLLEETVFQLVNFMVYLHSQVKSAKTFMRRKMREKKDILMKPLVQKGLKKTMFGTVASPGRHGPQRSPSRLSIGSPGRIGSPGSRSSRLNSNIGSPGRIGSPVGRIGTAVASPGSRSGIGSPVGSRRGFSSPRGIIGSPFGIWT